MTEKEFFIIGKKIYQIINGKAVEVGKKGKGLAKPSVQTIKEKNIWTTK